ncbi:MAG: barstar family protein [Thermoanaerobaculia bacterium]
MFEFENPHRASLHGADLFVRVCGHIASKEELFAVLACGLELPSYFGRNWDALDECLRFLEEPRAAVVVIAHTSLPDLSEEDLSTYVSVLASAVEFMAQDQRLLKVYFPPDEKERVLRLLQLAAEGEDKAN